MKQARWILLLLIPGMQMSAQDELGIAGSTRAPVNTVYFNPASIADSRTFIDVELSGVNAFAFNNLAYVGKEDFSLTDYGGIGNVQYNHNKKKYTAKVNATYRGPSFTANWKEHAFGVHTGVQVMADIRKLPNATSYLITDGLDYRPQIGQTQTVEKMRLGLLAYGYVGISYATIAYRWDNAILLGGITVNRLLSPGAFGGRLDDWTYTLQDSSKLVTQSLNGEMAFNSFGNGLISGKGWGVDIGATYKKRTKGSFGYTPWNPCTDGKYEYKASIALLDFGSVKFKAPYYRYTFDNTAGGNFNGGGGTHWDEPASADTTIANGFGATANTSGSKLKMKLPTALSAQLDYHVHRKLYAMGALTLAFPWKNKLGIQRATYLAVVPRWESANYEISLPITLYEFKKPMVGLAFRVRSVIIGSDYLNAFLFNGNLYGANIYVHVKMALFKHPKCKSSTSGGRADFTKRKTRPVRQAPKSPVPCPRF
jgi:hypothetical protein